MSAPFPAEEIREVATALDDGFAPPGNFQMPTIGEIEQDLALADPSWQSLIRSHPDGGMEATTGSPPALGRRGHRGPATWCELHPVVPDEFVCGYLKEQGVTHAVAENVAREASQAFRDSPYWHVTAAGRSELILRLYWTLLDAGQTSQSSRLGGELLKELLNRRATGADRITSR